MTDLSPVPALVNPFVIFRKQLDTYRQAIDAGWSDDDYCNTVTRFNARIEVVDGVGFAVTPLVELETPLARPVVAKVETGGVAGSHKARHLFGLLLQAEIQTPGANTRWAIASCGNAALAAAVVAKAASRPLEVFVPTDADDFVVARLHQLDAEVVRCPRTGQTVGDPCMEALQAATKDGAEPFTVQGPLCPGVFDGARTLGLELAEQLEARDGPPATDIYLQVGGGAFGSAVMDGLVLAGVDLPRLHPVQPQRAHPYAAAWERLVPRLLSEAGLDNPGSPKELAKILRSPAQTGAFDALIDAADDVMSPWPTTPTSVASGILDDITYDWRPLVRHQLRSGGWPLLPSESDFLDATELASAQTRPPPDATGAAGLAGALIDQPAEGTAVVVLSGVDRTWSPTAQADVAR